MYVCVYIYFSVHRPAAAHLYIRKKGKTGWEGSAGERVGVGGWEGGREGEREGGRERVKKGGKEENLSYGKKRKTPFLGPTPFLEKHPFLGK